MRATVFLSLFFALIASGIADGPIVPGSVAVLRAGVAHAPSQAPQAVKDAIWAVNLLRDKPYRWGGGHATFEDRGYDCSGTISYLLHHAAGMAFPTPSKGMCSYGEQGVGRWITVYARHGHVFAMVAGLRLDTTDMGGGREGPRWHTNTRKTAQFVARHPKGL